jgi:F-type H+-transporting ATPase subunit b
VRIRALLAALLLAGGALLALSGTAAAQESDESGTEISHEAEECIEILEGGGEPDECNEAPSPILPATDELVWGAISFTVLLFAMWKFALPSVRKTMEDRTARIRTSLTEAEEAKEEADALRVEYQTKLQEARTESAGIIEESRQAADAVRRDLIARAEAEAAQLRARNAEQIDAERARVMSELQGQVATLAIELAERVVGANLDRDANLRLIEEYIRSIGTDPAGTVGAGRG